MLQVENLEVSYGAINALRNVSFHVEQGEIISLIGSNGAGKTTTLHAISNIIKKRAGEILFEGEDITHLAPDMIVRKKLIQVPEGRRIFLNLSVRDNLEMGAFTRTDKDGIKRDMQKVFELFPRLKERVSQISGTLSGGELQMLAMGRALMSNPKLLLLDEPSMGLAPILVDEIFEIVQKINKTGTTVLLVEQNAFKALSISNRAYVLETGKISKEGLASDLANDPAVKEAYLGG
ncbi:MAG: ABC transporter ATP-binding protein [Treponemataceae bacterium]|nr:ABC transporter ATP-binding protein [Treponemataceae bacterium]